MARQRVIGYTRVSTQEQVEGFGLEVQESGIRAYCRSHGLRLVALLSDQGQSGSNGLDTRHGLAEALARIESGDATALVVYRYDRLARDVILQETLIRRLDDQGVGVQSVQEPLTEGEEHTRKMVRQILGVIADHERAVIKGRMTAGKAAKVAAGGYGGGRPAYGSRASGGSLETNPDELVIVERVTSLRASGASYREIAKALADAGLTTRTGGQWNPNQVRRIAQRAGVA
jgi:DNA invertase Pin-like site-specific DNA recombinase